MHPNGYHKSDVAKQRCWSCSHPENLMPTPEHMAEARRLVAEGWLSTSNRYRHLSRYKWPKLDEVIQPQWKDTILEQELRAFMESHHSYMVRVHGEHLEVSPQVFYAFKSIGGRSA